MSLEKFLIFLLICIISKRCIHIYTLTKNLSFLIILKLIEKSILKLEFRFEKINKLFY